MTNEKFLEILMEIEGTFAYDDNLSAEHQTASQLPNDDLAAFIKALGGVSALPFIVEQAIRDVKNDIAVKSLPSENVRRLKACRYILNHNKKDFRKECYKYANTINGIQYISNGFFAAAFKKPLPLEERPESVLLDFNFKNIFPLSDRNGKIELELPDRLALESFVKIKKLNEKAKNFPTILSIILEKICLLLMLSFL